MNYSTKEINDINEFCKAIKKIPIPKGWALMTPELEEYIVKITFKIVKTEELK